MLAAEIAAVRQSQGRPGDLPEQCTHQEEAQALQEAVRALEGGEAHQLSSPSARRPASKRRNPAPMEEASVSSYS